LSLRNKKFLRCLLTHRNTRAARAIKVAGGSWPRRAPDATAADTAPAAVTDYLADIRLGEWDRAWLRSLFSTIAVTAARSRAR